MISACLLDSSEAMEAVVAVVLSVPYVPYVPCRFSQPFRLMILVTNQGDPKSLAVKSYQPKKAFDCDSGGLGAYSA